MANLDKRTKTILGLLNAARQILRLPPLADIPKGIQGSDYECPIARALGPGVRVDAFYAELYWVEGITVWHIDRIRRAWETFECENPFCVHLPSVMSTWITEFDAGLHPEYRESLEEQEARAHKEQIRHGQERRDLAWEEIGEETCSASHARASRFE